MDTFDESSEAQDIRDNEDDESLELEKTDIDSDELMDGEVDANGASSIRRRNT